MDSSVDTSFEPGCYSSSSEEERAAFIKTARDVLKQRLNKMFKEPEKESEALKEDIYISQFRNKFDLGDEAL
jgi:hypothetical protein